MRYSRNSRLSAVVWPLLSLTVGAGCAPVVAQELLPSWQGVEGDNPAALKNAGWQLNANAAGKASFAMPLQGSFRLHDGDIGGAPSATLPFKSLEQGTLSLKIGVADLQNANATLRLMAGDKVLVEFFLLNHEQGSIKTGAGTQQFQGSGWGIQQRDLVISWTGAGDGKTGTVSVAFDAGTAQGRVAAKIDNVPLLGIGAPSALKLDVGFGSAVNRTMLVSDLSLQAAPSTTPDFSQPRANPATQDFEDGATLADWKATDSTVALTDTRYFSGQQSLRWSWNQPGAQLTFASKTAFSGLNEKSALGLWLYNATPTTDLVDGELLSSGKVVGSFWFRLNYSGWRPVGVPYSLVAAGQSFDAVRFSAPSSVKTGNLNFDFFNTNAIGPKNPVKYTPPLRADYQQPWIFEPSLLASPEKTVYSSDDWNLNRPYNSSLAALTAQQKADLAALTARLLPPPIHARGGLDAGAFNPIRAQIKAWGIARTASGTNGLPITHDTFNTPPASIKLTDYMKMVTEVASAFGQANDPAQIEELRGLFQLLMDHWIESGWCEGNNQMGWLGNGYDVREWAKSILSMRDELGTPQRRDAVLKSLAWFFGEGRELGQEKPQYTSVDTIFNYNQNLAPAFLALSDQRETVQRLKALQRYFDFFFLEAQTVGTNGTTNPLMGPDGTIIHHQMHNILYGSYSVPDVMKRSIDAMMHTKSFRLSPASHERMRVYVENNAFSGFNGDFTPNMNPRSGTPHKWNLAELTKIMAFWGTTDVKQPLDLRMAALYLTLNQDVSDATAKQFLAQGIVPRPQLGHLALNSGVASIQRRPGWLTSMVGMHRNWIGDEIYGWLWSNNYSRYARNGTLFVQSESSPLGGWKNDGWNWNFWPGATSLVRPSAELFDYYDAFGNRSPMAGGTTLGNNGIWGMDFSPAPSPKKDDVSFRKSAFFFDNRVVLITSGITSTKDRPTVTTLYQSALDKTDTPTVLDGRSLTSLPDIQQPPSAGAHWLMDNRSNGYYIPAGQGNLQVKRQSQEWLYLFPRYAKDPNDVPVTIGSANTIVKLRFPNPADNEKFYNPTKGDFALAYLEHGVNPTNSGAAYIMQVQTTTTVMANFAKAMSNPKSAPLQIVRQDNAAHIVYDRATSTKGYVFFEPVTNLEGVLKSANLPCFVMVRPEGNTLQMSVANTDTDSLTPPTPVRLTLDGVWKLPQGATARVKAMPAQNETILEISPDSNLPLEFQVINRQK